MLSTLMISSTANLNFIFRFGLKTWGQLFEGRLTLNPGLNLTGASFS